ncbi:TATA box-binding protein-associated factor RNA polymerase I subunit C [Scyliorhinus torazame]|uniref:TATA box-binding protein-associated factor RNA polymerase I subunit C n=1 Tax=Scyliorhinus torazame TaxID=75743 RepID=UPI003B5B8D60
MASAFPYSLFPSFYSPGPSARNPRDPGGWGKYEQVQPFCVETGEQQETELKWSALKSLKRESWEPLEPVAVPLLPAKTVFKFLPVSLEDLSYTGRIMTAGGRDDVTMRPLNFTDQMANFFLDQPTDAFSSMGKLLEENFYFGESALRGKARHTAISVNHMRTFTEQVQQKECPLSTWSKRTRLLSLLLRESIFDIPPNLLAENIHEEMKIQRNKLLFDHSATGGALVYCPFSKEARLEEGCLIYPGSESMNSLNFRKIRLDFDDKMPKLNVKFKPVKFNLNGRIHQIDSSTVEEEVFVGVRSDYYCGVWKLSQEMNPSALQVVQVDNMATCINVSPHVPGEVVIANECGAAYLWILDKSLQKIRRETDNLYFNAQLPWRWCDFTAHPRVYIYADRTGLDLTDTRAGETCNQTLFKIGAAADCQRGERVILPKHLRDVNPYHHLITTQYSAYIVDERFPTVPVLKWAHMLESPPMFAQVACGAAKNRTNKIVLGTQRTQEVLLLQYSGGMQLPCQSFGPPQKLSCIYDMMQHLPVRLPQRREVVADRLHSAGAGLATLYHCRGKKSLSVFQLSAVGDLFYQMLIPKSPSTNRKNMTRARGGYGHEPHNSVLSEEIQSSKHSTEPTDGSADLAHRESERPEDNTSPNGVDEQGLQSSNKPLTPSCAALATCRRWMNSFLKNQKKFQSDSNMLHKHTIFSTKRLFSVKVFRKGKESTDTRSEMWNKMHAVMEKKQVLCSSTFPILDHVHVPNVVDPSVWRDELSERLTAAWEGKWSEWWKEKLGVNRSKKIQALRAKRRREKLARAGQRRELSGSFTSSVSDLTDLSEFSDWSRSSVMDLSGTESNVVSNKSSDVEQSIRTVTEEPRQEKESQSNVSVVEESQASTPFLSQEIQLVSIPKERKRILQNYLAALEDHLPQPSHEDDGINFPLPLAMSKQMPFAESSQVTSTCEMSWQPPSQSQPGQFQPKKKRARMGF